MRTCARPTARAATSTWSARPHPRTDEAKKLVYLDIDIDEGKQFYISRIEFTGNTITRDKVIRRELLVEEGQVYNSQLVDLSPAAPEPAQLLRHPQDRPGRRDPPERRRRHRRPAHQAEGEGQELHRRQRRHQRTLRLLHRPQLRDQQLPRPRRNALRQRQHRRPLAQPQLRASTSPTCATSPSRWACRSSAARPTTTRPRATPSPTARAPNLTNAQHSLLTNYNQSTNGLTISSQRGRCVTSSAARASPASASRTRSRKSGITTFNDNTRTSSRRWPSAPASPGRTSSTASSPPSSRPASASRRWTAASGPHNGKDFNVAFQLAGVGGNTKYYSPVASFRQFFPMKGLKVNREGHNVLGYRLQLANIAGYRRPGRSAVQPHLRRRRKRHPRLRHPLGLALHLHPDQGELQPHQPRRLARSRATPPTPRSATSRSRCRSTASPPSAATPASPPTSSTASPSSTRSPSPSSPTSA